MDRQDLVFLLTNVVTLTCLLWFRYQYLTKSKVHEVAQSGKTYLNEILIGHPRKCPDIFKMSSGCFLLLANELKCRGLLRDSRTVTVEEQFAEGQNVASTLQMFSPLYCITLLDAS